MRKLHDRYASLIGGSTPEEIKVAAALLAEMLQKKIEEVEVGVKVSMVRTEVPGARAAIGDEVGPKDCYAGLMNEQKGRCSGKYMFIISFNSCLLLHNSRKRRAGKNREKPGLKRSLCRFYT